MAREIKFRVWHPTQGMTYTPVLSTSSYTGNVSCLGILADSTRTNLHLMQFTGLKDKKGAEIYDGDTVTCPRWACNLTVVYDDEFAGWFLVDTGGYLEMLSDQVKSIEVIGNIYEQ